MLANLSSEVIDCILNCNNHFLDVVKRMQNFIHKEWSSVFSQKILSSTRQGILPDK